MSAEIEDLIQKSKSHRERKDARGLQYANEAYNKAREEQNKQLAVIAMRERINYALYVHPNHGEAEKLALELIDIIDTAEDPFQTGAVYNILGICNDVRGNYIGSRDWYLKTIDVITTVPDITDDAKITLGNAYANLAKLYHQLQAAEERKVYIDKAQAIFESFNYVEGLARVWNHRAGILPESAPIEERLALFEKSYSYFVNGTDKINCFACLGNIGLCHCRLGNFNAGIQTLEEALIGAKETRSLPLIGFVQFQLAEGLRLKGDYELAGQFLDEAEDTFLKGNVVVYLDVIYKERAQLLDALGNHQEAYKKMLLLLEHVSHRSQFDRHSAVEEARFKFEMEKKEKESELLRRQNKEVELYNEKLKQSNAELNQFAYVASHDLKEPLRMVSNYMQLLEKSVEHGGLTADQVAYIRYANEGAKRMYGLIDSLLSFSRSTMNTELKQVDMNDVLDEVLRVILTSVNRKVHIDSDELPTIEIDYNQMVQLFQNLVANGIKYNDQKEVMIHISYKAESEHHRFAVEDNGLGIEPQHREKVFDIFKRLHTRDSYSGTGIGLSICQKIIYGLNGRIWIEDSALGGTSVVFTIPKKEM